MVANSLLLDRKRKIMKMKPGQKVKISDSDHLPAHLRGKIGVLKHWMFDSMYAIEVDGKDYAITSFVPIIKGVYDDKEVVQI